jgi:hypothetical protein
MQPSSEAESRKRGCLAFERSGVLVVRHQGPSSESEFPGTSCLLGRWCYPGRGHVERNLPLVGSFMFLLFREKLDFPPLIRGPLWLSPTVAPEPLRRYPLGTR